MLNLVIGQSASGKSEYAENLARKLYENSAGRLYYVATMNPYGEDGLRRIERHRRMRRGKGFETIERQTDIGGITGERGDVFLIECMSNLLANEMFDNHEKEEDVLLRKIVVPIVKLSEKVSSVTVVTNDVFADGREYATDTKLYRKMLGRINVELAKLADNVVEVTAGVPVYIKGSEDA
ncbi:MAG: bifunctional adenosylcobinamide kinase/adenosylcobinamide-phosphate guanylyltransferase [Lachnospiraceae bacterium]|nr:bifunctional adenosylcobinamide kinase/adenosylcobinamide-phosphate guanylyltransferase [Lachnospiraceae bacterium]